MAKSPKSPKFFGFFHSGSLVVSGAKREPFLYPTRDAAEHERDVLLGAGRKNVFVRLHHKAELAGGVKGYSVESISPEREAKPHKSGTCKDKKRKAVC